MKLSVPFRQSARGDQHTTQVLYAPACPMQVERGVVERISGGAQLGKDPGDLLSGVKPARDGFVVLDLSEGVEDSLQPGTNGARPARSAAPERGAGRRSGCTDHSATGR